MENNRKPKQNYIFWHKINIYYRYVLQLRKKYSTQMKTEADMTRVYFPVHILQNWNHRSSVSYITLNRKLLLLCDWTGANQFIIEPDFLHLTNSNIETNCRYLQNVDRYICNYKYFCFAIIYCLIIISSFATWPCYIISVTNIIIKMNFLMFQFGCRHPSTELACFAACLLRSAASTWTCWSEKCQYVIHFICQHILTSE